MAAIAKQCFAFLLLAALFSGEIAARESRFFNKVPSNNADSEIIAAAAPANQDPDPTFVPENENGGYGLYGHNAGQLPPATTTNTPSSVSRVSTPKYLPKNYNVEAYVTVPEGYRGAQENGNNNAATTTAAAEFDNNKNPNFYKSEPEQNFGEANLYSNGNYFNNKMDDSENENENEEFNNQDAIDNTNFYDSKKEANFYNENNNEEEENPNVFNGQKTEFNNYNNNGGEFNSKKNFNLYNNGGSERAEEFNSKKNFNLYDNGNSYYNGQKYNGGLEEAKFGDSSKYNSFESNNNGVQKQGMSDTRFLENGKYFYDVDMENQKYNRNYNRPATKNNAYNYNNYYQGQDLP